MLTYNEGMKSLEILTIMPMSAPTKVLARYLCYQVPGNSVTFSLYLKAGLVYICTAFHSVLSILSRDTVQRVKYLAFYFKSRFSSYPSHPLGIAKPSIY